MHKNIDRILNILKFAHKIYAGIVWPSSKGFIDLTTYFEINTKHCNIYYNNFDV
jgi:hypothetical protein